MPTPLLPLIAHAVEADVRLLALAVTRAAP
jgi:hypothetical protein